ncbi:MAG: hypothetical protein HOV81_34995 [Kofleriaceae bacterium]|nr:hypothetical protein [Kofleriaceae bacterium]
MNAKGIALALADEARPFVFPDAEAPAWLAARTDALVLAIHRRLDACCR